MSINKLITSSSICSQVVASYFAIVGTRYFKKHSMQRSSVTFTFHRLRCFFPSWTWYEICVEVVYQKWVRSSNQVSWWTGSWKKVKNERARVSNVRWELTTSHTYHFMARSMRVHWNSLRRTKSLVMLLEEHHKWNFMMWFARSPPPFLQILVYLKEMWLA